MIPMDDLREMKLLNLHHRFGYAVENLKDSHNINAYCPLSFEANPMRKSKINNKIQIITMNPQHLHHLAETANIINESTQGNLTAQSIKSWTETGVFDPELWLGAIDIKSNSLVGIGISTHNPSVKETDLDWFYIREDHQGEGIGTMLVQETISRCRGKSRVIRVAGIADEFYIKCGFVRRDTWYYLTKKSSKVGWWD